MFSTFLSGYLREKSFFHTRYHSSLHFLIVIRPTAMIGRRSLVLVLSTSFRRYGTALPEMTTSPGFKRRTQLVGNSYIFEL